MLRAKNYTNISVINKKKNYNCEFCDFVTPLFNDLKLHVKKNHIEAPGKNAKVRRRSSVGDNRTLRVSFSNPRARSDESLLNNTSRVQER